MGFHPHANGHGRRPLRCGPERHDISANSQSIYRHPSVILPSKEEQGYRAIGLLQVSKRQLPGLSRDAQLRAIEMDGLGDLCANGIRNGEIRPMLISIAGDLYPRLSGAGLSAVPVGNFDLERPFHERSYLGHLISIEAEIFRLQLKTLGLR